MADAVWIRLDVDWSAREWTYDLRPAARLAWIELICYVKTHGVRGSIRVTPARILAGKLHLEPEDITEMIEAAEKEGALIVDGDRWLVANWGKYQQDSTAGERQQRARDKKKEQIADEDECDATDNHARHGDKRDVTQVTHVTLTGTGTGTSNTLSLSAREPETAKVVAKPPADWAETPEETAELDRLDRHLTHCGKPISIPQRDMIRAKARGKPPGWLTRAVDLTIEKGGRSLLDPDEPRESPPRAKQGRPSTDHEAMFAMGKRAFANFGGDK